MCILDSNMAIISPSATTTALFIYIFVCSILVVSPAQQATVQGNETVPESFYVENALNLVTHFKKDVREKLGRVFNQSQLYAIESSNSSSGCIDQVKSSLNSPLNTLSFEWLVQMYQSSGGIPNGIHTGMTLSLGDFDQCLRINEKANFSETQYCLLTLRMRRSAKYRPFELTNEQRNSITEWQLEQMNQLLLTDNRAPIAIGLCLPALCNDQEKNRLVFNSSGLAQYFDAEVGYCQSKSQDGGWMPLLPLLFGLAILFSLCILGSFLDFLSSTQFGKDWSDLFEFFIIRFLLCFSQITNTRMLFDVRPRKRDHNKSSNTPTAVINGRPRPPTKTNVRAPNLDILDGLRVFAMFWIIVAHCTSYSQVPNLMKLSPFSHYPNDFIRMKDNNWVLSFYIMGSYFPVSIFFMISGILVVYNRKRNLQCSGNQHFIQNLVTRFLRLSPTMLFTMALTYFSRYLGTGPLFHQQLVEPYVEPCKKYFWYHFFMLHNFLSIEQRCGSHTWYIGADFWLTVLAFFVVHLARCRSKLFSGMFIAFAIIALASFIQFCLVIFGFNYPNYDQYLDPSEELPLMDYTLLYYATYNHAGQFFIGVILGFLLSSGWDFSYIYKNRLMRFTLLQLVAGILLVVPFALRYFTFPYNLQGPKKPPLLVLFMVLFFSYTYCLAMAALIFILTFNPKMYIAKFLSAHVCRPMSRMVFTAYLFHQPFIWFTLQQLRSPHPINFFTQIEFTALIICLTVFGSMLGYTVIEAPFIRITKMIFANASDTNKSDLMMRSISTVESSTRSTGNQQTAADSQGNEFQSIIPRQSLSQLTDPGTFLRQSENNFINIDLSSADQNNNTGRTAPNGTS